MARLLTTDSLFSCNASSVAGNGTRAVVLHSAELQPETADWLRCILKVGGIFVQIYPRMARNEFWSRLDRDRSVFNEHLVPARRYFQVRPRRKNRKQRDDESWVVTCGDLDVYLANKPALLTTRASTSPRPLLAWAKGQATKASVCEISECLTHPSTLVRLMARIGQADSPFSLQRMPPPPQLKYSGRLLRGKAPWSSPVRSFPGYARRTPAILRVRFFRRAARSHRVQSRRTVRLSYSPSAIVVWATPISL